MAITAGTTAQRHSDECRARIEPKMLEDVTGEGAMRFEEAITQKHARPDDESGRADVAMEVAARNPIRLVQHGGSSSSWEVRPEPSRPREAEEQLGRGQSKAAGSSGFCAYTRGGAATAS